MRDGQPVDERRFEIDKAFPRLAIDKAKRAIIQRIFAMIDTMGVGQIGATFNTERIPTLSARKRQRGSMIWDKTTIAKLIRGKQVLGIQEVGRYDNKKRTVTGEMTSYPAVISEEIWNNAQDAVTGRKSGVGTGRNVTRFTNLFGDLARCVCGERMSVHRRGNRGEYVYFGCSMVHQGRCQNRKFHRLDHVEQRMKVLFGVIAHDAPKVIDHRPRHRTELAKMESSLSAMAMQFAGADGAMKAVMVKLAASIDAKKVLLRKLDHDYAKPSKDVLATVWNGLDGLSGAELVKARGKIAATLPTILRRVTFLPDGSHTVTLADGYILPPTYQTTGVNSFGVTFGDPLPVPTVGRVGDPLPVGRIGGTIPVKVPDAVMNAAGKRSAEALAAFLKDQKGRHKAA